MRLRRWNDGSIFDGRIRADPPRWSSGVMECWSNEICVLLKTPTLHYSILLSRGGVTDFVVQISNEKTKPLIERTFFEDALTPQRIVDKCRGHKIGQHFEITQFRKVPINFRWELAAVVFQARVELDHLRAERFGLDGRCVARFDDIDSCHRERRFLFETDEAHALEPLQDQIRRAVAAANASANQSNGGELKKVLRRVPIRTTRLDKRHAKHAMMLKRVLQHLAITRLENIERKQCVGKEHRAGQRHYRQLFWQNYG